MKQQNNVIRFYKKIKEIGDCWVWIGHCHDNGYGQFSIKGKGIVAHRFAYITFKGDIPEGLQIDHLCRNRKCVNPGHLELVTPLENVNRNPKINRNKILTNPERKTQTHCKRGHLFDDLNTNIRPNGRRSCRTCHRLRTKRFYANHGGQHAYRQSKGF